ncbi:MAG: serine O-acetyltransferase [Proteobacteria bacterium]|nr:serine O-acetyltransferase [Pseudomonadota bacterium]
MFKRLNKDIEVFLERDPAARSRLEVFFCYPGFHAVVWHRLAHALWLRGFCFLGRFASHLGRMLTGIEIHPGAKIGEGLVIDHGAGVVIGETAEVGRNVTLYQGVTLGGTSLHKGKRHPTLEDDVIVGAGAQVLGPITVGAGARIGANAVVIDDVPKGATMVGIPARMVGRRKDSDHDFAAYGTPKGLPDPVVQAIEGLRGQIVELRGRIEELERAAGEGAAGEGEGRRAERQTSVRA